MMGWVDVPDVAGPGDASWRCRGCGLSCGADRCRSCLALVAAMGSYPAVLASGVHLPGEEEVSLKSRLIALAG